MSLTLSLVKVPSNVSIHFLSDVGGNFAFYNKKYKVDDEFFVVHSLVRGITVNFLHN